AIRLEILPNCFGCWSCRMIKFYKNFENKKKSAEIPARPVRREFYPRHPCSIIVGTLMTLMQMINTDNKTILY
ncbi:MAG: hypothetical protein ACLFPH_08925, partial [Bacteroidales bacterium]